MHVLGSYHDWKVKKNDKLYRLNRQWRKSDETKINDTTVKFFFEKNGPIPASLCLFSFFPYNFQIEKSIDGVLGIRTLGRRMVGADETTELWRPLLWSLFITLSSGHEAQFPSSSKKQVFRRQNTISWTLRRQVYNVGE